MLHAVAGGSSCPLVELLEVVSAIVFLILISSILLTWGTSAQSKRKCTRESSAHNLCWKCRGFEDTSVSHQLSLRRTMKSEADSKESNAISMPFNSGTGTSEIDGDCWRHHFPRHLGLGGTN